MAEAPSYHLPPLPHLRLRCTLRAAGEARLPELQGSLLRGAFGHALRQIACTMGPAQLCATCRRRQTCPYTQVFETFIEGSPPPFLAGLATAPRPYVFEPGDLSYDFEDGDPLTFELVLLGRAVAAAPLAVLAVDRMAEGGLGARRHRFELMRVEAEEARGRWRDAGSAAAPRLPTGHDTSLAGDDLPRGEVTLHFLTPTRLLVKGEPVRHPTSRLLAFKMISRHLELAHFFGNPEEIDWEFRPLLDAASRVSVVDSRLTWVDWERYSNRQRTKMTLGGFVGSLTLAGDLEPLAPLLRAAEVEHVGKGATFGMGRMKIEAASQEMGAPD